MLLSDTTIRTAKPTDKPRKLSDGRGLYLLVKRVSSKSDSGKWWRFDYRFDGKRKTLSMGTYPDVSLAKARAKCDEARRLLADDIDPGAERKAEKNAQATNFEAVARTWYAKQRVSMVATFAEKVIRSLEVDVFPAIGARAIAEIKPPEVLAMLRKVEARGALETLKRVRQRTSDVFTFAIATGVRADVNPVIGLEKALQTAKAEHRPSLHFRQLPEFFIRLNAARISAPVKHAVRLSLLTFLRPGELRCARWQEIDLDAATWMVPGERDRARGLVGMKMKSTHTVPLSRQAVESFRALQAYSGDGDLVFPNRNDPNRPISDGTVNSALRAMGYSTDQACGHGFRATAASALAEMGYRREVIDCQLSHKERSAVLGAYTHQAEYLDERRSMMQHWADHLDGLQAGRSRPLKRKRDA